MNQAGVLYSPFAQVARARGPSFTTVLRTLSVFLLMLLAGCTTVGPGYAPETSFASSEDIAALKREFQTATSVDDYYAVEPETAHRRNRFIAGRLVLYDLGYADFVSRFRFGRAAESTVFDTATLGVNHAITLFGGARTKEVLGAISAAIIGGRSSYEKNFFDEQAASAIAAQMNAERKAALVPIMAGTKASIDEYPLTAALIDLANYQRAGTVDGALAGIHREAGIKETKAIADLEQYRSVSYAPDTSSDRIQKWLYPGFDKYNDNDEPIDKNGAVIRNPAQVQMLEDELEKLGLGGLPIATFLDSPTLGPMREKAIRDLQIP